VVPSRRFLILVAAGFLPAAASLAAPGFWPVAVFYLAACCAAMAATAAYGVDPKRIRAERRVRTTLSIGEPETVQLLVRNDTGRPVRLTVADTLPEGWSDQPRQAELLLGAGEEQVVEYTVVPPRRGAFAFGDLYLRLEQWPWLTARQWSVKAGVAVRVLPDLRGVARYELMARRSRLAELGVHRSRAQGRGTEFERLRDYTPDDEYRRIDWKATARRRRPITRVYELERSQQVLVVLDAGRMMAGSEGRLSRLDHAVNAALMLAHVALKNGDRVGLMVVSDTVDAFLPPGKGQAQLKRFLDTLYRVEARLCHVDYRGALEQIARRMNRRALIVFLTDLVDEETSEDLLTYLRLLRPTHLPLCVALQDRQLLAAANRAVAEPETMYVRAAAVDLLADRRRVLEGLQRQGAQVLDVPPDELAVQVINRYLDLKQRQLL
jgi:uncharacterized protein (DUF58 family)